MFTFLSKWLLGGMAMQLLDNYRRQSIQLFKIEAALCYVRGVQMLRLSAMGLMRMGLVIGLICIGAVLFHVALFVLLPWTVKTKAVLGLLLGSGYIATGCVALRGSMDEKTWLAQSGAAGLLEAAAGLSDES